MFHLNDKNNSATAIVNFNQSLNDSNIIQKANRIQQIRHTNIQTISAEHK